MKTEIKALPVSLALSLLALLGACSSVNSTPNSEVPSDDNSVILEDTEEGIETVEDLSPDDITGDATTETEVIDSESAQVETVEPEVIDGETTEVETIDGMGEEEALEPEPIDGIGEEEALEPEPIDGIGEEEALEPEAIDGDSAEVETDSTEIILPEGDSADVETDPEAAEGVYPETEPEQY